MNAFDGLRRFFRLPAAESHALELIDDELDFHLACRTERLVAEGIPAAEARQQAEREFGDLSGARRELTAVVSQRVRRARRSALGDALRHEMLAALRTVRKDPLFAVPVVLTLGLAIGANALMFGIADITLLRPPPHVQQADEVVRVYHRSEAGEDPTFIIGYSYPEYVTLREQAPAFAGLAAYSLTSGSVGRGEGASRRRLLVATASYFSTLGVRPQIGRFYKETEEGPGREAHVAVLSHAYWQEQYSGSAAVLGETIDIGKYRYEVIGVMPEGFRGVDLNPFDMIIPVSAHAESVRGAEWSSSTGWSWLSVIATGGSGYRHPIRPGC